MVARERPPGRIAVPIDVEQLYRRYGIMVLRRCRRLLGDEEAAADAMHDVFVQLTRRREVLTAEAPSSLLYTIATQICLNRLRTLRRRPETRDEALLDSIAQAEEPGGRAWARLVLRRVLGPEPSSTRAMATMYYVDGMTLDEVARVTGPSVPGVRKRLKQLRTRVAALAEPT